MSPGGQALGRVQWVNMLRGAAGSGEQEGSQPTVATQLLYYLPTCGNVHSVLADLTVFFR